MATSGTILLSYESVHNGAVKVCVSVCLWVCVCVSVCVLRKIHQRAAEAACWSQKSWLMKGAIYSAFTVP